MMAKMDTVTPVCWSIVVSFGFPLTVPSPLPSSFSAAFPSRLSSGDVEPFEPFDPFPMLSPVFSFELPELVLPFVPVLALALPFVLPFVLSLVFVFSPVVSFCQRT